MKILLFRNFLNLSPSPAAGTMNGENVSIKCKWYGVFYLLDTGQAACNLELAAYMTIKK